MIRRALIPSAVGILSLLLWGVHVENAGNTRHWFIDKLDANPEIQRIADEYGFSCPVPSVAHPGKVEVFAFLVTGLPPHPRRAHPPRYLILASFPSLKVDSVGQIKESELGVPLQEDHTLGAVGWPEKYADVVGKQADDLKARFEEHYSEALEAFLGNRAIDPAAARDIEELLPVFGPGPLVPLLRKTSPAFFAALDRAARR
jgi:hypothetical protein